jgi:hypothetical protein
LPRRPFNRGHSDWAQSPRRFIFGQNFEQMANWAVFGCKPTAPWPLRAPSLLQKFVAFAVVTATGLCDSPASDFPRGSWLPLKRSFVQQRISLGEAVGCRSWLSVISRYVLKFGRNRSYELSGPNLCLGHACQESIRRAPVCTRGAGNRCPLDDATGGQDDVRGAHAEMTAVAMGGAPSSPDSCLDHQCQIAVRGRPKAEGGRQ